MGKRYGSVAEMMEDLMAEETDKLAYTVKPGVVEIVGLPPNARVRRLINGKYVAEVWNWWSWYGVDVGGPCFLCTPNHFDYCRCIVNTVEEAIDVLASRGV
jgi:hypothetical protein